jgi:hypothetical protein
LIKARLLITVPATCGIFAGRVQNLLEHRIEDRRNQGPAVLHYLAGAPIEPEIADARFKFLAKSGFRLAQPRWTRAYAGA